MVRGVLDMYIWRQVFVAELNRTELQTKFPTIATEIPH